MEQDLENTYSGIEYGRARQQMEQLRGPYMRILRKLSPEDQAVLEKYDHLTEMVREEFGKRSYLIGYQQGIKQGKK